MQPVAAGGGGRGARCRARCSFALAAFSLQPPRCQRPGSADCPRAAGAVLGALPWVASPCSGRLTRSRRGWVLGTQEPFLHGPPRAPFCGSLSVPFCASVPSARWGAGLCTPAPSPGVPTQGSGSPVALRVNLGTSVGDAGARRGQVVFQLHRPGRLLPSWDMAGMRTRGGRTGPGAPRAQPQTSDPSTQPRRSPWGPPAGQRAARLGTLRWNQVRAGVLGGGAARTRPPPAPSTRAIRRSPW